MMLDVAEWRPDILEEHTETLEALWNRRLRAERSALADRVALRRLDTRIEAHADALVLAGAHALRVLEPFFAPAEPPAAAAVASVVARVDAPELVARLSAALVGAPPEAHPGFWAALDLRAGQKLRDALALLTGEPDLFAGAMAVLAGRNDRRAAAAPLERLLFDPSASARALAWKAVRRLGESVRLDTPAFERGLTDPDAQVRRAAIEAAVVRNHGLVLEHLRRVALAPDPLRLEEHLLYAMLTGPADLESVRKLYYNNALGWDRYRIMVACGRAAAMEDLLAIMRAGDPIEVALAGASFYRITGVRVSLPDRIPLVAPGMEPDGFTDEIARCDVDRAAKTWQTLKGSMGTARWGYGCDAEATPPEALSYEVDLELLWATELRAAHAAKRNPRFAHEEEHLIA
jgi:uncharacterized protein (TIGR02270 family)